MTSLIFWHILFMTLLHKVTNERDVVAKYKSYLILEKILNASIIEFHKSIIPLIQSVDQTDEISSSSSTFSNLKIPFSPNLNTFEPRAITSSKNNAKISSSSTLNITVELPASNDNLNYTKEFVSSTSKLKVNDELRTSNPNLKNIIMSSASNRNVNNDISTTKSNSKIVSTSRNVSDNLNKTSSVHEMSSLIVKNTTSNASTTNKTVEHNRSLRRNNEDTLEKILGKLEGSGREELFYEPYWPGGEFVFMRTGSRQNSYYRNQIDEYRDCDRTCSVFEDKWYGRICACRRDDWWIDLVLRNFSSLCAMEKENCLTPLKRPGWFPIHRGTCTYSSNPHDFLSTFDEFYGGSTQRFFDRAKHYESEFEHLYPTHPSF